MNVAFILWGITVLFWVYSLIGSITAKTYRKKAFHGNNMIISAIAVWVFYFLGLML